MLIIARFYIFIMSVHFGEKIMKSRRDREIYRNCKSTQQSWN